MTVEVEGGMSDQWGRIVYFSVSVTFQPSSPQSPSSPHIATPCGQNGESSSLDQPQMLPSSEVVPQEQLKLAEELSNNGSLDSQMLQGDIGKEGVTAARTSGPAEGERENGGKVVKDDTKQLPQAEMEKEERDSGPRYG